MEFSWVTFYDYPNNPFHVHTKGRINRRYQHDRNIHQETKIVLYKTIASVSSAKRAIYWPKWHINLPSDVKWNSLKAIPMLTIFSNWKQFDGSHNEWMSNESACITLWKPYSRSVEVSFVYLIRVLYLSNKNIDFWWFFNLIQGEIMSYSSKGYPDKSLIVDLCTPNGYYRFRHKDM